MKNNEQCSICTNGRIAPHPHAVEPLGRDGEGNEDLKTEDDFIYFVEKGYNKIEHEKHIFYYAVEKRYLSVVKLLIKRGWEVHGSYQQKPLHDAIYFADLKIAKFLIENGSDISTSDLEGFPCWSNCIYPHIHHATKKIEYDVF